MGRVFSSALHRALCRQFHHETMAIETHNDGASRRRLLVVSLGNPGSLYENAPLGRPPSARLPPEPAAAVRRAAAAAAHDAEAGQKASPRLVRPRLHVGSEPTLMNVSGPWVGAAWRDALADAKNKGLAPADLGVVIVHDDLEEDLGVVKIRRWDASHRGHNGLKSIKSSLRPADWPGVQVGAHIRRHRPARRQRPRHRVGLRAAAHEQQPDGLFQRRGRPGRAEVSAGVGGVMGEGHGETGDSQEGRG